MKLCKFGSYVRFHSLGIENVHSIDFEFQIKDESGDRIVNKWKASQFTMNLRILK